MVASTSSTQFEDAEAQLAEARVRGARGQLVDREWVLMTVRGLTGLLSSVDETRSAPILEQANVLAAAALAQDEVEFAPLREDIRRGRYTVDDWRAQMVTRSALEQDVYTARLLGLHDPPY